MRKISQSRGRITLDLLIQQTGRDYTLILTGGDAHIGAVAFAEAGGEATCIQALHHREGEIATELATMLASALGRNIAVICGIHYDGIAREEIAAIESMAGEMALKFAEEENVETGRIAGIRGTTEKRPD